jgi:hypothetical protein
MHNYIYIYTYIEARIGIMGSKLQESLFLVSHRQEKSLGLPVGMLNDREKINRCYPSAGVKCQFLNVLTHVFAKLFVSDMGFVSGVILCAGGNLIRKWADV